MSKKETDRINDLIGEVRVMTNGVYDKAHDHLKSEFVDFAQSEAEFANKAINTATRSKIANRLPSPARLKAIVTADPLHGEILGSWVKRMGDNTADRLAQQIRLGAAAGEKVDKIVERIVGTEGFEGSRNSARAMVRTSLNAISTQTQQETWAANSDIIKGWQFVGTLDSRTTLVCSSLDGQVFPLGEGPMPPRHWNCRSTTIAVTKSHDEMGIKGKQYTASTRASMDGQIAAPVRMEDFLRSKGEAFQDTIFRSKQRADLWRRGKLNLNDFIRNYDEVIPLDELRRLHPEAFGGEAGPIGPGAAAPEPVTKPVAPKLFSPINRAVNASTVAVRPRKTIAQDLTRLFTNTKGDTRYDPRPEFRGMKPEDFGKASLTGLTDEASSMVAALMPEVDAICDAFAIPRLRAIKTGEGKSYIARMGDGTLTLNPVYINGYAGEIGEKAGSTVVATLLVDRDKLSLELKAMREAIDAIKADLPKLTGAEKDAAIMRYMDQADAFNAKRADFLKLDKKVLKARRTDTAATVQEASTWKPGDDPAKRPYITASYFANPFDRARSVFYHELAHHVHQMRGKAGRRNVVGTPPVEKALKAMFSNKFFKLGKGYEAKKLVASTYATQDEFEWFAENFAMYMMGRFDLVEPELKELIERLLEEAK